MAQREETRSGAPLRARRPERLRRQGQGSYCKQQQRDRDPCVAQGARSPQPTARGPGPRQRAAGAAPPHAAGR
eukprot:13109820-Alexandrium_andersonii.AAC.1